MSEKTLFEILFLLVIVLTIVYKLYKHKIKGVFGESIVARRLKKLNKKQYTVLNDILIKTSRGSSQIDHIVISIYGVFVIETKNYNGWIHGHEKSEYWTQSIYKKKTKFRNPIKQNWAHIYALKEILSDFKHLTFYPIIVFAGRAKLKNITSDIPVIYKRQLIRTIKRQTTTLNLSTTHVKNIADRLKELNIQDRKAKIVHNREVKHQARDRKQNENRKMCPRCGGDLIVRYGRYGKFYGCSNYPKCRYKLSYRAR